MSKEEILKNNGLGPWMRDCPLITATIFECMDIYAGEQSPQPVPAPNVGEDVEFPPSLPEAIDKMILNEVERRYHESATKPKEDFIDGATWAAGALCIQAHRWTPASYRLPEPQRAVDLKIEGKETTGYYSDKFNLFYAGEPPLPYDVEHVEWRESCTETPAPGEVPADVKEWIGNRCDEVYSCPPNAPCDILEEKWPLHEAYGKGMEDMYHKMQEKLSIYEKAIAFDGIDLPIKPADAIAWIDKAAEMEREGKDLPFGGYRQIALTIYERTSNRTADNAWQWIQQCNAMREQLDESRNDTAVFKEWYEAAKASRDTNGRKAAEQMDGYARCKAALCKIIVACGPLKGNPNCDYILKVAEEAVGINEQ